MHDVPSVTVDACVDEGNVRQKMEAMVARFRAEAPTHAALLAMDEVAVGGLLTSVLVEVGTLQVDVLEELLYDPRLRGYVDGAKPGQDVTLPMAEGSRVLREGWGWMVREGLLVHGDAGGWTVTRKGRDAMGRMRRVSGTGRLARLVSMAFAKGRSVAPPDRHAP